MHESIFEKINRLIWYFKQLFPLKYVSTFTEKGVRKKCSWRMWMGKSFNVKYYNLKQKKRPTKLYYYGIDSPQQDTKPFDFK